MASENRSFLLGAIVVAALIGGGVGFSVGKAQGLDQRVPAFNLGYLEGYCQGTYALWDRIPQDERFGLGVLDWEYEVGRGLGPELDILTPTLPYSPSRGPWKAPGGNWNPPSGEINHSTIGDYVCRGTVRAPAASWEFDLLKWPSRDDR